MNKPSMPEERPYDDQKIWDYLVSMNRADKEKVVLYMIKVRRCSMYDAQIAAENRGLLVSPGNVDNTVEQMTGVTPSRDDATIKTVPKPRLVGIELNPGPPKPRKSLKVIIKPNTQRVAKRKTNKRSVGPSMSIQHKLTTDYLNTLRDPWEHPPIKLGFNTFQTTVVATGYRRANFTVAADGSFAVAMVPSATGMIMTNNNGVNVATWATANATNATILQQQMLEARIVSGGLRLFCLFPETSAPGVLYSTTDLSLSSTLIAATTPNGVAGIPSAELGIGSRGSRIVMLPIDNDSYSFYSSNISGITANGLPYMPTLLIAGTGFPVGTVVYYEAIINLEGLPNNTSGAGQGIDINATPTGSLSDLFPTPQSLYSAVRGVLGNAVTLDAIVGLAGTLGEAAGVPGARTASRIVRSSLGQGRNFRNSLVAGANVARQAHQSTVIIEEMKDEYSMVRRH